MLLLEFILLSVVCVYCCFGSNIRFINLATLHEESLNTISGITNGTLVTEMFFETCLFQAVSGPAMACVPKCMANSNCLATSMNRTIGCMMCLNDIESGRPASHFGNSEIFVRIDQLERFIDSKSLYSHILYIIFIIFLFVYFHGLLSFFRMTIFALITLQMDNISRFTIVK